MTIRIEFKSTDSPKEFKKPKAYLYTFQFSKLKNLLMFYYDYKKEIIYVCGNLLLSWTISFHQITPNHDWNECCQIRIYFVRYTQVDDGVIIIPYI